MKLLGTIASLWRTKYSPWQIATLGSIALLLFLFVRNAWVVDESFITFRTVDNFVHGYGLTFNVGERVQAYTHPLWMFVMTLAALFSSQYYFSVLVVSLLCTLGLLVTAAPLFGPRCGVNLGPRWRMPLFVLLLCCSKAFVDFCSSGLENPLSHLIAALFVLRAMQVTEHDEPLSEKDLFGLFFIAAISGFNRLDTVLLYVPVLLYCGIVSLKQLRFRVLRAAILGTLPVTLWLVFSIVYYGFAFPNTFYAKLAMSNISYVKMLKIGANSFRNSWQWDPITQFMFIVAAVSAIVPQRWNRASRSYMVSLTMIAGVVLYLVYALVNAASATHMSGRFFSVPFVIATLVTLYNLRSKTIAATLCTAAIVVSAFSDRASIKFGTQEYATDFDAPSVIDTKLAVYLEGAALLNYKRGMTAPNHKWYREGVEFSKGDEKVAIYLPGYFGFGAGPDKWIVDRMGLTDPLLGRLPGKQHPNRKGGHFLRDIPKGYLDSIRQNKNLIVDPNLHEYYDIIITITQGPIFRWQRFKYIWEMNRKKYDYLIKST